MVAGVAVGPPPKENGFAAAGAGVDAEVVAGGATLKEGPPKGKAPPAVVQDEGGRACWSG